MTDDDLLAATLGEPGALALAFAVIPVLRAYETRIAARDPREARFDSESARNSHPTGTADMSDTTLVRYARPTGIPA